MEKRALKSISKLQNPKTEKTENTIEQKWNILKTIHSLLDCLVECKLKPERTPKYQTKLQILNEYFDTNETQTWILCYAIYEHFKSNTNIMPSEFAEFLDVNVLKIAEMYKDFASLKQRKLLKFDESNSQFEIKSDVIKSVLKNESIKILPNDSNSYIEFVSQVGKMYENRKYTDDTCYELCEQIKVTEINYEQVPFIIRAKKIILDERYRYLFYDICNDCLQGYNSQLTTLLEGIFDSWERHFIGREFLEEKNILFSFGLIEFCNKGNLLDSYIHLTEKGKQLFFDTDYELYTEKMDDSSLKQPKDIHYKKMFYNEQNQIQIDDLSKALSQQNYNQIQKRLKEQGLPSGIAVIFYGAPGCGKTETVYQIAKKTGRPIFQVDISNTKSCWFGESEKKIKQVFTDYKEMCKKTEKVKNGRTPILLFNECDAIFSKRKDVENSNTAQVENAIQNIVLEELENLQGILIATTNLVNNLDSAFERRFLFKVKFENPSISSKKAIWKNKIKWITPTQAENLAKSYNFSGGEIDNIVRKMQMKEIISGIKPSFNDIVEMCKVEKLNDSSYQRVGFV